MSNGWLGGSSHLEDIEEVLARRFACKPRASNVVLTGILFAHPKHAFSKNEIYPLVGQYHARTGDLIDIFVAGFPPASPFVKRNQPPRLGKFNDFEYDHLRQEIAKHTSWKATGGPEIILLNARYLPAVHLAYLDYSCAITIDLQQAAKHDAFVSFAHLIEALAQHAETGPGENPVRNFSQTFGKKLGVKSAFGLLLARSSGVAPIARI